MNSKEIVELALGTADVQAITPKVIAKTIDDVARNEVVFTQLFRENKDFLRSPGRRLEIPKLEDNIVVSSDVGENTTLPPSSFSYDALTVDVAKFGVRLEIPKEVLESTARDLLKDAVYMVGKKYADELDKRAQTIALDLKTGSITSWSGGTLGSTTLTPVISISSVPSGATVSSVDYYSGKVLLTSSISSGTLTFLYSDRCRSNGFYLDANTKQYLKIWDVLNLRSTLISNSIHPDVLLVHPSEVTTLLYDPDTQTLFVHERLYAGKDDKLNGELGQIVDLKVVSSANVPEGVGILVDSSRLGYDVIKRDLDGNEEIKPDYDSVFYHFWAEREMAVSDDNAIGVIVNAKQGEYGAASL